MLRQTVTFIGFVAYLACFPYVIYMALAIAYPDLLKMRKKGPAIGVIVVVLFMGAARYIAGSNHAYLLTCEDFEISGNHVPADCRHS